MSSAWRVRWVAVVLAVAALAVALTIRALAGGALEQHSGTALYASMVYAGVLFLAPRAHPALTAALAVAFCWLVELSQLTGIPAELSQRSLVARLALGVQFDPVDLIWYPVGVLPLAVAHWAVAARRLLS